VARLAASLARPTEALPLEKIEIVVTLNQIRIVFAEAVAGLACDGVGKKEISWFGLIQALESRDVWRSGSQFTREIGSRLAVGFRAGVHSGGSPPLRRPQKKTGVRRDGPPSGVRITPISAFRSGEEKSTRGWYCETWRSSMWTTRSPRNPATTTVRGLDLKLSDNTNRVALRISSCHLGDRAFFAVGEIDEPRL